MAEVEISRDRAVLELRFNRPTKRNAITNDMYRALITGFETLEADAELRACLLSAEGGDFCAGNDIAAFVAPRQEPLAARGLLELLPKLSKPIVAAVQGKAVGIGATILLHCDLVYASTDLDLRFMFVDIGVTPEAGSTLLLPRLAGRVRAAEAMLLTRPLNAQKAVAWGIANEVVEPAEVRSTAMEAAQALAGKPPGALAAAKALLRGDVDQLVATVHHEMQVFSEMLDGPEFAQAAERFLKR